MLTDKPASTAFDSKWASLLFTVAAAILSAYLTASSQIVRLEERLQAEITMRQAADTRHDAERVQDRAELLQRLSDLTALVKEALASRRTER